MNSFRGIRNYQSKMSAVLDSKVYVGVTPETDPRQDMPVANGYTSDDITKHGFGEEPIRSNAQLLLKNITGGDSFDFYPFDLIYSTSVIPSDGMIRELQETGIEFEGGHITPRDFVRPPFRSMFPQIASRLKRVVFNASRDRDHREILNNLGNDVKREIVGYALRHNFDPNPQIYSAIKGNKPPLQLTGQMLESITSEVVKK